MEKFLFTLIFIYSINPIFPTTHFDSSQRYLHVYQDDNEVNKPLVIKNTDLDLAEVINQRFRRDLTSSDRNENLKNITTKVNTQTKNFFSLISERSKAKLIIFIMRHFNRLYLYAGTYNGNFIVSPEIYKNHFCPEKNKKELEKKMMHGVFLCCWL